MLFSLFLLYNFISEFHNIFVTGILRYVTTLNCTISLSSKMNKNNSCVLCRNFISIYKIKRTLHGRLGIRILSSRAENISRFPKRPCNILYVKQGRMDELDIKSYRLNSYFKIRSIERDENCTKAL